MADNPEWKVWTVSMCVWEWEWEREGGCVSALQPSMGFLSTGRPDATCHLHSINVITDLCKNMVVCISYQGQEECQKPRWVNRWKGFFCPPSPPPPNIQLILSKMKNSLAKRRVWAVRLPYSQFVHHCVVTVCVCLCECHAQVWSLGWYGISLVQLSGESHRKRKLWQVPHSQWICSMGFPLMPTCNVQMNRGFLQTHLWPINAYLGIRRAQRCGGVGEYYLSSEQWWNKYSDLFIQVKAAVQVCKDTPFKVNV